MTRMFTLIFAVVLSLLPQSAIFAQDGPIEKTYCTYALGYESIERMKLDLLNNAKRQAVNEFFGEFISAYTSVENSVVTTDQIRASSLGFVRVSGDAMYYNGTSFAEVCVLISAFVTQKDLELIEPVKAKKRVCLAREGMAADQLASLVKEEAVVGALYDYDSQLNTLDRERILPLMRKLTYSESDFLPGTTTYCAEVEGEVTPIEILAALAPVVDVDLDERSVPTSSDPNALDSSATGVPSLGVTSAAKQPVPCDEHIAYDQNMACDISQVDAMNFHEFEADAGDLALITVIQTAGQLDPVFRLYDSNNNYMYCGDDGAKLAETVCSIENAGNYTIQIGSKAGDKIGTYSLRLQRLNMPVGSRIIEYGSVSEGDVTTVSQYEFYTFEADVSDRLLITAVRTDGRFEPAFRLYNSRGSYVYCADSDPKIAYADCTVESADDYSIWMYSSSPDKIGKYSLRIQKLNSPAGAIPLNYDEEIIGEIDTVSDNNFYTFEADAGDTVRIKATRTTGTFEPSFSLHDSRGEYQYCSDNDARMAEANCSIGEADTYTIWLSSKSPEKTGGYTIIISKR